MNQKTLVEIVRTDDLQVVNFLGMEPGVWGDYAFTLSVTQDQEIYYVFKPVYQEGNTDLFNALSMELYNGNERLFTVPFQNLVSWCGLFQPESSDSFTVRINKRADQNFADINGSVRFHLMITAVQARNNPDFCSSTDNPPTLFDLTQFDGSTSIEEGGIIRNPNVGFFAYINDPENDQVKLQVELRQINEPFTGNNDGGILTSDLVASGSGVKVNRTELSDGAYHWRARAVDEHGNESAWQEFRSIGNTDFEIRTNEPPILLLEGQWPSHCNGSFTALAVHPSDKNIIYIGSSDIEDGCGIYKTNDSGRSWILASEGIPFSTHYSPISKIVVSPSNPDIVYAGTAFPLSPFPGGSVFRSEDGGMHWKERGGTAGIFGISRDIVLPVIDLAVDPQNSDVVYAGLAQDGVYKTVDGGLDWREVKVGINTTYSSIIRVDPKRPNIVFASQTTSTNVPLPLCGFLVGGFAEKGCISGSAINSSIFKNIASGNEKSWDFVNVVGRCGLHCLLNYTDLAINAFDSDVLYLSTRSAHLQLGPVVSISSGQGVLKSIDGGGHWQTINDGGDFNLSDFIMTRIIADPVIRNRLFAVGIKNQTYTIFYSLNDGQSWKSLQTEEISGLTIINLYLNHNNDPSGRMSDAPRLSLISSSSSSSSFSFGGVGFSFFAFSSSAIFLIGFSAFIFSSFFIILIFL